MPLGAWADVAGTGDVTFGQFDMAKEPPKRARLEKI